MVKVLNHVKATERVSAIANLVKSHFIPDMKTDTADSQSQSKQVLRKLFVKTYSEGWETYRSDKSEMGNKKWRTQYHCYYVRARSRIFTPAAHSLLTDTSRAIVTAATYILYRHSLCQKGPKKDKLLKWETRINLSLSLCRKQGCSELWTNMPVCSNRFRSIWGVK